jgi:hypothetical protein
MAGLSAAGSRQAAGGNWQLAVGSWQGEKMPIELSRLNGRVLKQKKNDLGSRLKNFFVISQSVF